VVDASESLPSEGAATSETVPLEDIEQDLNNVDKALAALDSGNLDAAEALAAELDSPSAATLDGDGPAC
jgi:hypothetical protein